MKTHEEAMKVFNKFGLQVEEVESTVYKVLNNTHEVCIDDLEFELEQCLMLVSDKINSKKLPEGYWISFVYVYYIILDYNNDDALWKYEEISRQSRRTIVRSFKYNPNYVESIDTLYTLEELGLAKTQA